MSNNKAFFTSMTETPGAFVILVDKTQVSVLGKGIAKIDFNGCIVLVPDCLYVPALCAPFYSIRHHRRYQGCSFIVDNNSCILSFPSFTINVNDISNCLSSIAPAEVDTKVMFDAKIYPTSSTCKVHFAHHASV
eukprot:15364439-Ditylum_brightwellii.AAC.5